MDEEEVNLPFSLVVIPYFQGSPSFFQCEDILSYSLIALAHSIVPVTLDMTPAAWFCITIMSNNGLATVVTLYNIV